MSGPDTSRGINFQYACAISVILELVENTNWEMIQLEGDEDIEDISIFGADNHIIERIQIKQKRDPNQWKPSEFRDIILSFANLDDPEAVSYRVIYAGSEGPEFYSKLKPLLLKIQIDGWESLSDEELDQLSKNLNNEKASQFLERTQQRFRIEKHDSWEGKRIKDLEKIRNFFKHLKSENNIDADSIIYSSLFEKIATKNEGEIKYSRQLTKSELYLLLKIEQPIIHKTHLDKTEYFKWIHDGANSWADSISLMMQEESPYPEILNLVISVQSKSNQDSDSKPLSLSSIIERIPQVVLFGESGSGKTVSLWQIALNTIKEEFDINENHSIPVYIDLSNYDGEQIYQLIQNSISASGQQVSVKFINEAAMKGEFVLLLDGYDHCRTSLRQDLQFRLKSWLKNNPQNAVVIVTHNPSDGNNLELPTFKVQSLSPEQSTKILSEIAEIDNKDITNIRYSLNSDSEYLVKNPLLLKMLAYYYVHFNRSIPRSRSPLYESMIDGILALSERKGFSEFDRDLKLKLLASIAGWMQSNEIYSISPSTISNLLSEWSKENSLISSQILANLNHLRLHLELLHSGLFQFQLNGNIQFIHSTFRSFLAMYTITEEKINEIIGDNKWDNSILFWASQVGLEKSEIIFDYLDEDITFLGQILEERTEKRVNHDFDKFHWNNYFDDFCMHFLNLVRSFPLLLSYKPWNKLVSSGLDLFVCVTETDNLTLYFRPSTIKDSKVKMVQRNEIEKLQKTEASTMPLPFFLIPKRIVANYHPLELSYLWILRSLFDHLYFFGQEGGIDTSKVDPKILPDPAFSLIINRFVLYQELCSKLPSSIQTKLPFYATQPFSLVIELHIYAAPPFVRYAIIENIHPKSVGIIPIMYSNIQDVEHRIIYNGDGTTNVIFDNRTYISTSAKDIQLHDLYRGSPGAIAQSWLRDFLQNNLIGFPPRDW